MGRRDFRINLGNLGGKNMPRKNCLKIIEGKFENIEKSRFLENPFSDASGTPRTKPALDRLFTNWEDFG